MVNYINARNFNYINKGRYMKAIWNGKTIAESNNTIIVEGNHYFPPNSVEKDFFNNSDTHTSCIWKGKASYLTLTVDGQLNIDSAWFYPNPSGEALHIKDYVAFWKGVEITS